MKKLVLFAFLGLFSLKSSAQTVSISPQPSGFDYLVSICVGTSIQLTASTTGFTTPTYQWQYFKTLSPSGWTNISGATGNTLNISSSTGSVTVGATIIPNSTETDFRVNVQESGTGTIYRDGAGNHGRISVIDVQRSVGGIPPEIYDASILCLPIGSSQYLEGNEPSTNFSYDGSSLTESTDWLLNDISQMNNDDDFEATTIGIYKYRYRVEHPTIYIQGSSEHFCNFDSQPLNLVVCIPEPILASASTLFPCFGQTVSLTATGCPVGGTYRWSNGLTGANPSYVPNQSETLTVTCINGATSTTSISPIALKVSPSTVSTPYIFANRVVYTPDQDVIVSSLGCATEVLWSNGINAGAQMTNRFPVGTYRFTARCKTGCTISDESNVLLIRVVNPPTIPQIAVSATSGCIGDYINLSATNCTGEVIWSTGQRGANVVLTLINSTSIWAKCEENFMLSAASSYIPVVLRQSRATVTTSSTNVCEGTSVSMTATGCPDFVFWTNTITNKVKYGTNFSFNPTLLEGQTTSVNKIIVTCASELCAFPERNIQNITVKEVPNVSIRSDKYSYTTGESAILTVFPSNMAYAWTGPTQFASTLQIPTVANLTPSNMGFYNVNVTNPNNGCSAIGQLFLQVRNANSRFGINEDFLDALRVNVYPNPSTDLITLEYVSEKPNHILAEIVDSRGVIVMNKDDDSPTYQHTLKFDVSSINSGVYFLVVNDNGRQIIKKIVKVTE